MHPVEVEGPPQPLEAGRGGLGRSDRHHRADPAVGAQVGHQEGGEGVLPDHRVHPRIEADLHRRDPRRVAGDLFDGLLPGGVLGPDTAPHPQADAEDLTKLAVQLGSRIATRALGEDEVVVH